jgi:hypothetical protein
LIASAATKISAKPAFSFRDAVFSSPLSASAKVAAAPRNGTPRSVLAQRDPTLAEDAAGSSRCPENVSIKQND